MNIFCPNCEHECSEKATACPECGHPFVALARPLPDIQQLAAAAQVQAHLQAQQPPIIVRPVQTVQTIEKTGKFWKGLMVLCVVMMGIGIGACMGAGDSTQDQDQADFGRLLAWVGLVGFFFSRIGAWWDHG